MAGGGSASLFGGANAPQGLGSNPPLSTKDKEDIANQVMSMINLGMYAKSRDLGIYAKTSSLIDFVTATQLNAMDLVDRPKLEAAIKGVALPPQVQ